MIETIRQISDVIRNNGSFLVTTHEGPDGDAVGSSLGLALFLRALGKDVHVHYQDPVPDLYTFLPGADTVSRSIPDRDFDVAFVLDIGERRRAGKEFCSFTRVKTVVNLDHHLACDNFGDFNLIDCTAAATGVLVYRVISDFGYQIDRDTALCLYVAILTDTGSFRYSNSNREAFAAAGELINTGINAWSVAEKLYESQPRERLELLSRCMQTLEMFANGQAAAVTITLPMYQETGGNAELTDGFVNYPRSIRGVEVAVIFRQLDEHSWKIGFRSKGTVNVAAFSQSLGGGGHHNAAGCTLEGSYQEITARVKAIIEGSL